MQILYYILSILIAIVPNLWIEDYLISNPVWWTVVLAWHTGNLFGYFERE